MFDAGTESLLAETKERHRRAQESFADRWETQMKPLYFSPTAKLRALRQRAIDLAREGRIEEGRAAVDAAVEEELMETIIAQAGFQRDYEVSQMKMKKERDAELEAIEKERMEKRGGICRGVRARSQSVSRVVTPRLSRG
jgi:hypothetical protein